MSVGQALRPSRVAGLPCTRHGQAGVRYEEAPTMQTTLW